MDRGEARKLAREHLAEVSEHTAAEYSRAHDRLGGMHWRDYAQAHKATKRTASVLRAAWRRSVASQLIDAINQSEKAATADDRRAARSQMDALALSLLEDTLASAYQPPEGSARAGAGSKRKTLRKLPPDWRAVMFKNATPDDKFRILALACGARPEEIRKGVKIDFLEDYVIKVTIQGAKVTEKSGQDERVLTIKNIGTLIGVKFKAGKSRIIASDPGQAFQKRVTRLAEKLKFDGVTPYSFRHAFAADLKKSGATSSEIAKSLGQQSEKTQRHYGHASQSRGSRRLDVEVEATTATRPEMTTLKSRLDQRKSNAMVMQDQDVVTRPERPSPSMHPE